MKLKITILTLFLGLGFVQSVFPQDFKSTFSNLIGGKWITEGNWTSSNTFKQEIVFEWGLDSLMVKTKTYGFVDKEGKKFGLRNEGIRFVDQKSKTIRFWEFDIFGETTEGVCIIDGKNIYYEYRYIIDGEQKIMRDSWIFLSQNKYQFIVGIFGNGKWEKKFLETAFIRK